MKLKNLLCCSAAFPIFRFSFAGWNFPRRPGLHLFVTNQLLSSFPQILPLRSTWLPFDPRSTWPVDVIINMQEEAGCTLATSETQETEEARAKFAPHFQGANSLMNENVPQNGGEGLSNLAPRRESNVFQKENKTAFEMTFRLSLCCVFRPDGDWPRRLTSPALLFTGEGQPRVTDARNKRVCTYTL